MSEPMFAVYIGDKRSTELALCDYRVPVFWRRRLAVEWAKEHLADDWFVARVNITKRSRQTVKP